MKKYILLFLLIPYTASAFILAGVYGKGSGVVTYAPNAPTASAASSGATSNAITWSYGATDGSHSAGTSVKLYRGTTAAGESGTPVATGITSSPYSDTGLTTSQIYYYYLKANNSAGDSTQSSEISATPTSGGGIDTTNQSLQLNANAGSGTSITDASTTPVTVTTNGSFSWVSGNISADSAVSIANTSSTTSATANGFIITGDTTNKLNPGSGAFSAMFWIKVSESTRGSYPTIFQGSNALSGATSLYTLQLDPSMKMRAYRTDGTNTPVALSSAAINNGAWRHVAVVMSGSAVSIYIDGTLSNTGTSAGTPNCDTSTGYYAFLTTVDRVPQTSFNGAIQHFRVFKRALTGTEISTAASTPLG